MIVVVVRHRSSWAKLQKWGASLGIIQLKPGTSCLGTSLADQSPIRAAHHRLSSLREYPPPPPSGAVTGVIMAMTGSCMVSYGVIRCPYWKVIIMAHRISHAYFLELPFLMPLCRGSYLCVKPPRFSNVHDKFRKFPVTVMYFERSVTYYIFVTRISSLPPRRRHGSR